MKKLILASASPRRKMLLDQSGIACEVFPSDIDEAVPSNSSPENVAIILAENKASHVAKDPLILRRVDRDDIVILGADTVVHFDGRILGKPINKEDSIKMLSLLSGQWHEVITGIALASPINGLLKSSFEVTRVKMKTMGLQEIESYIETGEPNDKAGSYGIQGLGALLVERVEGCYFNIVGLPLYQLSRLLHWVGVPIWGKLSIVKK